MSEKMNEKECKEWMKVKKYSMSELESLGKVLGLGLMIKHWNDWDWSEEYFKNRVRVFG